MKFARLVVAFALVTLLPSFARADEVRVAVASNFAPVLEKLEPLFERQSGHRLTIVSGATGNHYAQIMNGAPFDVFLAADDERPRMLEEAGKAAGTSFTYALGKLVLWSVKDGFVDAEGAVLKANAFEHLAIANPELAPYGEAAQHTLTALGLWDSVQRKLVQGDNIAQTLQFVETGNAELGFIALSQLLDIGSTGSYWNVPADVYEPIVQQGVLLKDSAAARAFIDFVKSDASKALIRAAGYELP
jgi:molybdate transport system substrate-binding protein